MFRRPNSVFLAVVAGIVITQLSPGEADAQGLLRRLRSRIQARIDTPPQPPKSPENKDAGEPQRVAPVSPATRRTEPVPRQNAASPRGLSQQGLSQQGPSQRGLPPSRTPSYRVKKPVNETRRGQYGGSILNPGGQAEAGGTIPAESAANAATLGVEVYPSASNIAGVEVARFRDESLADEAGLLTGDIIVAIDGKKTPTIAVVSGELAGKRIGQEVQARVVRGDKTIDLVIPLVSRRSAAGRFQRPPVEAASDGRERILTPVPIADSAGSVRSSAARLGVEVKDLRGLRGAVVTVIQPNSPAAASGLRVGDRIVSLDGKMVANTAAFSREVASRSAKDVLSIQWVRDGELMSPDVPLTLTNNDDPVRKVGFDEKAKSTGSPRDRSPTPASLGLSDDPPSLDALELPQGKAGPNKLPAPKVQRSKNADQLRDEIRKLEQQLEKLKAKN